MRILDAILVIKFYVDNVFAPDFRFVVRRPKAATRLVVEQVATLAVESDVREQRRPPTMQRTELRRPRRP